MKKKVQKLLKSYSFEIILFFLLLTGLFLLVVDVDLKKNIQRIFDLLIYFFTQLLNFTKVSLLGGIKFIKLSNLLGFLILILSLYLTLSRWKTRLLNQSNNKKICEKCNSKSNRLRKSNYLRFLEFFLRINIRVFKCGICNDKFITYKKK